MSSLTWISPKAVKRPSRIQGRGLVAVERIAQGETVAVKGGYVYGWDVHKEVEAQFGPADVQIGEDLFIGPRRREEVEGCMMHLNHSCNPNVGVRGDIVFVTLRDVEPGEELTFDYAMTDDEDCSMECRCGAANCRKLITGRDWQRPELQKRYAGYFSTYLLKKIQDHSPVGR
jgi:hypothetical protein